LQDSEGRRNATVKAKKASVFRHAINAQMERRIVKYINLTMPKFVTSAA
jgi:hypothetical protein